LRFEAAGVGLGKRRMVSLPYLRCVCAKTPDYYYKRGEDRFKKHIQGP